MHSVFWCMASVINSHLQYTSEKNQRHSILWTHPSLNHALLRALKTDYYHRKSESTHRKVTDMTELRNDQGVQSFFHGRDVGETEK
jgi:hypothetical protein